ncbi:helix-turn-helix transcriptional regulator [Conexibacter sp. JD483]|uniref:helix-turn-helix domain-containing protein n=1 Tax=unclassified Conexibacter TaxID=2627773 RepID=UPI00271FFE92|nr:MULTISPECIES: helix-turn-helix transcriptional regulator [unclassified Conexibacter]MDO8186476.1 helix-turn-helix transcriptional regulator [Conexibacter sp. CPCC 205706]MDO8200045.1 helix-turn-helix transcriptional regulator [Conexibacter sp. CPCC 205762]MDR9370879.1 helix-turn-helix transcriptional regulator [Conexibacter sp. JD483]
MPDSRTTHRRALATAVRVLRVERDLTQERVDTAGNLSHNSTKRTESGDTSVGFDILVGVAAGLGVSVSELMVEYERQLQKLTR